VQGGLRGALGVYPAIGAEIPELVQFTQRQLTMPVWAVGGDHSMNTGPLEQFRNLAERVTGGVIEIVDIGWQKSSQSDCSLSLGRFLVKGVDKRKTEQALWEGAMHSKSNQWEFF
jgi:hypothetical protein